MARDTDDSQPSSVEFFGVKLKVNNPHLAALLNSNVTDEVQVIGGRARSALVVDGSSEVEDARRDLPAPEVKDGSVNVELDGDDA